MFYDLAKRRLPDFGRTRRKYTAAAWAPNIGVPNELCLRRFERSLKHFEEQLGMQRIAAAALQVALGGLRGLSFIESAVGSQSAAHFLSFTVAPEIDRNRLLSDLHRRGLFLLRTWDSVPAFASNFSDVFPYGSEGSVFLADHIAHIPMIRFLAPAKRERLVQALRGVLSCAAAA
jgi:dTDP-4-amino-4,6-dideoxygalactose transaminase